MANSIRYYCEHLHLYITLCSLISITDNKKLDRWRDALQKGVAISALLYLAIPSIPMVTGAFALNTTSSNINHPSLIGIYFTVMLDGLVLSVLAMIPVLIIYLLKKHLLIVPKVFSVRFNQASTTVMPADAGIHR